MLGINQTDASILAALAARERLTAGEAAAAVRLSPAATSTANELRTVIRFLERGRALQLAHADRVRALRAHRADAAPRPGSVTGDI